MARCDKCSQELPQANGSPATQREFVPIGAPEKFAGICRTLSLMPAADERNKTSLADLPKTVARYRQLTVGQWKMFCAIHKQLTNTWPPDKAEFVVEEAPQSFSALPEDEDSIPF